MERVAKLGVFSSLRLFPAWTLAQVSVIQNWQAPASWNTSQSASVSGERSKSEEASQGAVLPPVPFVAMSPCRLADTRGNGFTGLYGAPSLLPGAARDFPVVGQCGIPSDAVAVSFSSRTIGCDS